MLRRSQNAKDHNPEAADIQQINAMASILITDAQNISLANNLSCSKLDLHFSRSYLHNGDGIIPSLEKENKQAIAKKKTVSIQLEPQIKILPALTNNNDNDDEESISTECLRFETDEVGFEESRTFIGFANSEFESSRSNLSIGLEDNEDDESLATEDLHFESDEVGFDESRNCISMPNIQSRFEESQLLFNKSAPSSLDWSFDPDGDEQ